MAKSLLRIKAEQLRRKGESVKSIARKLSVSRSSISLWTRDIILTEKQIASLFDNMRRGAARGRAKSALVYKERRERILNDSISSGTKKLGKMTDREFLIAGIALYWGEGCKKKHGVEFCNSDPKMIKFLIDWLRYCFDVPDSVIQCRVGINIMHEKRDEIIKKYWSNATGIPLNQFAKTSFKFVVNKKIYKNFDEYYGTLTVRVMRPGLLYNKIIGLMEGLYVSEQNKVYLAR